MYDGSTGEVGWNASGVGVERMKRTVDVNTRDEIGGSEGGRVGFELW